MADTLHTPLILRTGFFHSYKRTLIVIVVIYSGIYIVNYALGFSDWFLLIASDMIIITVLLVATWTIRKVVSSYHEMFGLFDNDILTKLSIYSGFEIDERIKPHKIQNLFITPDSYNNFRRKASTILFGKSEIWLLPLMGVICASYIVYYFATPGSWMGYGDYVPFWMPLRQILGIAIYFPLVSIYGIAGLIFIFRYFRLVHLLETSVEDFSVWELIRYMESEDDVLSTGVSYYRFYNDIAVVGRQIYEVTFQAVVTLVVGLLWYINFQHHPVIYNLVMSSIVIPIALFIFILPQLNLHSTLAKVKEAELQILENEHDAIKVKFLSQLRKQQGLGKTMSRLDPFERNSLCTEMNTLKDLIDDTRSAPTWSFRMPTTLKLLGTSVLPLFATVFQQMILPALVL